MISEAMINLLKLQISHELENMYIYQKIAMWLNIKGFKNLSKFYKQWAIEEKKHSVWVQEFLESINIYVDDDVNLSVNIGNVSSVQELTELTVKREMETTKLLEQCIEESYKPENLATITTFLDNIMLQEQIEEIDKANTINDQIKNIGENTALLQLFDDNYKYESG